MSQSSDPPNSGPYPGAGDPWSTPDSTPAPDPTAAPGPANPYPTPPSYPTYPTPSASNPWGLPPSPQTPESAGAVPPWQSQPVPPPLPGQSGAWGQPDQPGGQPPDQPAMPFPYGLPVPPGQVPPPADQPPPPYGAPGAPYPYGQPAAPSQPFTGQPGAPYPSPYPYGAPAAPSQPFYGQPAAPSQPFYGQPGMPTMPPPGWGPPSQTLPGAPPAPPAAPRKSHRTLWIVLASVAVLVLLLGGGGAFAFVQYFAPAAATGVFCGDLKTQDYAAAFKLLTANLQSQVPSDQFVQGAQTLDKLEGTVSSCATASGSSYNYSFGSSTASVTAVIKRSTAGSLQGVIRLKNEAGGWKVDGLDTNLLGINLSALAAASSFCVDLQTQNYASAYALLGSSATGTVTQQVFTQAAQLHDQIDGNISSCALDSIAAGASDSAASLGVSITRSKLGVRQGTVNLDVENNAWKIAVLDQTLLGSDLQPLAVGAQFCHDLSTGNFADAYNISSDDFKGGLSESDFAATFALPSPLAWAGCTPNLTTFKESGSTASYTASFSVKDTSTGQTIPFDFALGFVDQGGTWLVDTLTKP